MECNHFAQERTNVFGTRDVVDSFRFHPTLILLILKIVSFILYIYISVINVFCAALYAVLKISYIIVTFKLCHKYGARCSSVVRAFAHSAMGRRIDPSW